MKEQIYEVLNEVGVPCSLLGRAYIEAAIEIICSAGNRTILTTKELYPQIAKNFNVTPLRVERSIRHAVEKVFTETEASKLYAFFGNMVSCKKGKLTNTEFLYAIAKYIEVYGGVKNHE